jgi:integrase/recombinase XerC
VKDLPVAPLGAPAWVDHGVVPPRRLPASPIEQAAYLAEALGHPVYERWTWRRLLTVHGTLAEARRARPAVCRCLLNAPEAVEAWRRGRLQVIEGGTAPTVGTVVQALLRAHGKRFRPAQALLPTAPVEVTDPAVPAGLPNTSLADVLPAPLVDWLQRRGRLVHQALAAFLRERACRSKHTWRAYTAELQRLIDWCGKHSRGPLSDLTRQDLLAYRQALGSSADHNAGSGPRRDSEVPPPMATRSQARALAVVASLFRYWHDTGYLLGNPAAGLSGGIAARTGFAPKRFLPVALLETCDDWAAGNLAGASTEPADLQRWRRAAIWMLYRCAGVRVSELQWQPGSGLPCLDVDPRGDWTLRVLGKGAKERSIPLPRQCADVQRNYRLARGLPAAPHALERVPLIHGEKGTSLGARGLYDEVKGVFLDVADRLEPNRPDEAAILRTASPHWLRHAYARTLVVDRLVPLPAAQALLGHASVQTTAEYAKTDLAKLREFVEVGFGRGSVGSSAEQ